jgi:hypothetical protein
MSDYDEEEDVELEMNIEMVNRKKGLKRESLLKINGTNSYQNSVNVFVGKQRSGKTYSAIDEIIKITRKHPQTHLLIYVNHDGESNDETFEAVKHLISCEIVYVSQAECERYLKHFLEYKLAYNKIKDNYAEKEVPPEIKAELCENLMIGDLKMDYLHTLIFLEDSTHFKALQQPNSYLNNLMIQCAHIQCSFYVIIHYWKAITTNLKATLTNIYIYGGFSHQQLTYITYQINLPITSKELWNIYSKLTQYQKVLVNNTECSYSIL